MHTIRTATFAVGALLALVLALPAAAQEAIDLDAETVGPTGEASTPASEVPTLTDEQVAQMARKLSCFGVESAFSRQGSDDLPVPEFELLGGLEDRNRSLPPCDLVEGELSRNEPGLLLPPLIERRARSMAFCTLSDCERLLVFGEVLRLRSSEFVPLRLASPRSNCERGM